MKRSLPAILAALAFPLIMNAAEPLSVGAPAPEVSAVDQDGKTIDFKTAYAKGATLVYFYPKSDTPGCTAQACSLRDDWSALQEKNIQVIAVSGDDTAAQKQFQEKYKLPFTVIADSEGKVADAFWRAAEGEHRLPAVVPHQGRQGCLEHAEGLHREPFAGCAEGLRGAREELTWRSIRQTSNIERPTSNVEVGRFVA
jgi:peroxiredoxin Q/BCP